MHTESLELHDGVVRCIWDGKTIWEVPLSAIRVIGEMTNAETSYLDDYFICFATDANTWYRASVYGEGRAEILSALTMALGCEVSARLPASNVPQSSVLWPQHLAGTPMFRNDTVRPTTWMGRLFSGGQIAQSFADQVLAELHS